MKLSELRDRPGARKAGRRHWFTEGGSCKPVNTDRC